MRREYLEQMQAHVDEGGRLSHQNGVELFAEVMALRKILETPALEPFAEAAVIEARHQIYRWGAEHDAAKTAWDWYWTLGFLAGKAAHSAIAGDRDKALHHTITAAAMLANWHRQLIGD